MFRLLGDCIEAGKMARLRNGVANLVKCIASASSVDPPKSGKIARLLPKFVQKAVKSRVSIDLLQKILPNKDM